MSSVINATTTSGLQIQPDNSGSLQLKTNNGTTAVTIDTSQNVGIGTTSPTYKFQVSNTNGDTQVGVYDLSSSSSAARLDIRTSGTGASQWFIQTGNTASGLNGALRFYDQSVTTERMRIDSSGNLLLGTTSGPDGIRLVVKSTTIETHDFYRATSNSGSAAVGYWMSDVNGTKTAVAYIRTNGGLSNYSANNTNLSDERIKTDILPATNYLDKICSIPVVTFKYKNVENAEDNLGVIAQDVEAVAPELVNNDGFGETPEDGIPLKSIYQTDLQYALMKCIQEQQTIINDLKARIETLEAK